ncbi:MAG: HAMP domain-containing histidine kinase [Rhodobacteraceae bacterium]|nr:MAG: HAMP domain-containing histidine kinase [Paracoccaceae bacterium]
MRISAAQVPTADRAEAIGLFLAVVLLAAVTDALRLHGHAPAVLMHLSLAVAATVRLGWHIGVASSAAAALIVGLQQVLTSDPTVAFQHAAALGAGLLVATTAGRLLARPVDFPPADVRSTLRAVSALALVPAFLFAVLMQMSPLYSFGPTLAAALAGCTFAAPLAFASLRTLPGLAALAAGLVGAAGLLLVSPPLDPLLGLLLVFTLLAAASAILPASLSLLALIGAGVGLAVSLPPHGTGTAPAAAIIALAASGCLCIAGVTAARRLALAVAQDRAERRAQRIRYLLHERDEVTALAVHDLQSPIQAICGVQKTVLHMLESGRHDSAEMRQALAISVATGEDLSNRIGSVLNTSRPHLGGSGQTTPLSALVRQTLAAHRLRIEARGLQIETRIETEASVSDPDDIRDILDVLVDNALHHLPEGGCLTIGISRAPGDKTLALTVCDNGPGVAPERRQSLFSPPSALAPTEGRKGMGLFLASRRARALGADLDHQARPSGGACFTLHLRET